MNRHQSSKNNNNNTTTTTMRTIVTLYLNMGYMDGTEEKIMSVEQAQAALESLIQHKKDLLPEPDDLDLAPQVKVHKVLFVSLVPGKCSCEACCPCEVCEEDENEAPMSYNIQLKVAIHHKIPLSFDTANTVIETIYENGAMFPFTPDAEDAMPHFILYPYQSSVSNMDCGICIGEACSSDEDEDC
jgi:hypothetical protein